MTFAEFNCGITQSHWHTGEFTEGYYIEFWCPSLSAWTPDGKSFGDECTCDDPHLKARIQHTTTEIIEILPEEKKRNEFDLTEYDPELISWVKEQLQDRFDYMFMYGQEAYDLKYGGEDNAATNPD